MEINTTGKKALQVVIKFPKFLSNLILIFFKVSLLSPYKMFSPVFILSFLLSRLYNFFGNIFMILIFYFFPLCNSFFEQKPSAIITNSYLIESTTHKRRESVHKKIRSDVNVCRFFF